MANNYIYGDHNYKIEFYVDGVKITNKFSKKLVSGENIKTINGVNILGNSDDFVTVADLSTVTLDGPKVASAGQTIKFKITNFDSFSTYNFTFSAGTTSLVNDELTLNILSNATIGTKVLTAVHNGRTFKFNITIM